MRNDGEFGNIFNKDLPFIHIDTYEDYGEPKILPEIDELGYKPDNADTDQ